MMIFDNSYCMFKYQELATTANSVGFKAVIPASDSGSDGLEVHVSTKGGTTVSFVVHLRERGCFAFVGNNQFIELATTIVLREILRELADNPVWSETDLMNRLQSAAIRSLTAVEWRLEEWTALQMLQSEYGWRFVEEYETVQLESRYIECIASRMSLPLGRLTNLPVIQATWDVKHFFRHRGHEADSVEQEYVEMLLRSLQEVVHRDESIIARQQNRSPVLFYPHQGSYQASMNYWHIQVLPVERDFAFFDPLCSFGYIGHYLSGTVTAFGDKFVSALQSFQIDRLASRISIFPPTLEEWERQFPVWERSGWSRLSDSQAIRVKEMISELASDTDVEPIIPSRTWDISAITDSNPSSSNIEITLIATLIQALNRHAASDTTWFAWSEPYPVCKLEIPAACSIPNAWSWAIPVISRFENVYFVRSDLKEGVLCCNRTGQLCLLGEGMSTERLLLPLITSAVS